MAFLGWILQAEEGNVPLSPDGVEEMAAPDTQLFLLLLPLFLS